MQEINLYSLLKFYAKNWLLIVSLTLVGLLGGLVYNTYVQVPMYKSNATLLYISPTARSTQDVTLLNNYVELFTSRRVIEPVMQQLKVDRSLSDMASAVSAVNEKGTEVLKLTVSTDDPGLSRSFLRAAVITFKSQAADLYGADNLSVVDNASEATPPYNVKQPQQLAIATAAGFVVSLIVLFFVYDIKGASFNRSDKKSPKVATASTGKKPTTSGKKAAASAKTKTATVAAATKKTSAAKKPAAKKAPAATAAKPRAKKSTTTK